MTLAIRPAFALDAAPMAALLNDIIAAGGTTSHTSPVDADQIGDWMQSAPDGSAWHVAETVGAVVGFQFVEPHEKLPPQACDIATFVLRGRTGLGIGSALFDTTRGAALALGYDWINATIRTDNQGGVIYYQSRGFRPYDSQQGVTLGDGQVVDRVLMRFDLR